MTVCRICNRSLEVVTNTHLRVHGWTIEEYKREYGEAGVGVAVSPQNLPRDDPRYKRWRQGMKGRRAWNKGKSKETDPRVSKISETFRRKGIDNFAEWREWARKQGIIPSTYPRFEQNKCLAFLIGMIWGDGHLQEYRRTEALKISLGTDKPELIWYTKRMLEQIVGKKASVYKARDEECAHIQIYQKHLSERFGIPTGDRGNVKVELPSWVTEKEKYLIECLRGLFEAEGSLSIHKPTYTYNLAFSNRNQYLLDEVEKALRVLGFNPERRTDAVRLRRKNEVLEFEKLISFRRY